MNPEQTPDKFSDRKLGDEWIDWDGRSSTESSETDYRLFLGLAVLSTVFIILASGSFLWLIYPRLMATDRVVAKVFSILFLSFSVVLVFWLVLFVLSALTRWPSTRLIVMPRLVNKLLELAITLGRLLGISRDRLANSFLKIHNMIIGSKPAHTEPGRLLVIMPRCLTKENNLRLRELRDRFQFHMATAGGGSEARLKIREVRPKVVIAIACERDLLSGFKEVNPYIPVIGFPNRRPEGPCKNTCVDLDKIEEAIKKCLI